ncbi:phosphoribosylaminoimidazolesuccinocarboxamide synthase [Thermomonospora curvata]|uniref:Phosphoribosylaminoimidazole-succinocarboxamide synthase n=1 Tax=Thermomonospora curvata (strain ATCC 19995 / DSM 43183 / JCM 3096 / KCTC 9072 / NBRC 15933 / NCIMB 10081 / Henssen B9) TaxID=471852 RepID=D1AEI3_THECD|nr:phosphoribosylaminoimidazolesuccinocarboxamide synthase [Thermomonospora curvata]ACY95799.1 phosphoribosylaminoimidazole-succinocarboxamides ynthase [Thermomonospora curvata DSM 43183]
MKHLHSGKVRDLYELPGGELLMVARDTISAYDFVLEPVIPDKGKILTQLSLWWFEQLADVVPNHVISTELPDGAPAEWAGRAVVVRRLEMVPVECVARGYLTGSGLKEYRRSGSVCGVPLPEGLVDGSKLPEPIFTPTTKAALGAHDEPMTFAEVVSAVGAEVAERLREVTVEIYRRGARLAAERGIIVADTKIELGWSPEGELVLADEVLTPDSSRFWPADRWAPGGPQPSFDKQFVRDWLTSAEAGWDRASGDPPPPLPPHIVERTRAKYIEAYERLTGRAFG